MMVTSDFTATPSTRLVRDAKFRKEFLREGVECMLGGDIATAKTILRGCIDATIGLRN